MLFSWRSLQQLDPQYRPFEDSNQTTFTRLSLRFKETILDIPCVML